MPKSKSSHQDKFMHCKILTKNRPLLRMQIYKKLRRIYKKIANARTILSLSIGIASCRNLLDVHTKQRQISSTDERKGRDFNF